MLSDSINVMRRNGINYLKLGSELYITLFKNTFSAIWSNQRPLIRSSAVLPNLCAAAHKCAARAAELYRGRMSEIKIFNEKFQ